MKSLSNKKSVKKAIVKKAVAKKASTTAIKPAAVKAIVNRGKPLLQAFSIPDISEYPAGPQGAAVVSAALSATLTPLTPLTLAQCLKIYLDDPNFVAQGVQYGFSSLTAYQLGLLLFDASLYPGIGEVPMGAALLSAGFSQLDVDTALQQLYHPVVQFTVQANISWQSTGVTVGQGNAIVTYLSGEWTANPANGLVTAAGNPNYPAPYGYPLPGDNEGALVGRVDSKVFLIGLGITFAPQPGVLEVVINDDLDGIYGPGLTDNYGTVTISIANE